MTPEEEELYARLHAKKRAENVRARIAKDLGDGAAQTFDAYLSLEKWELAERLTYFNNLPKEKGE